MHADIGAGKPIAGLWSDQALLETVKRPLEYIRKCWTVL